MSGVTANSTLNSLVLTAKFQSPPNILLPVGLAEAAISAPVKSCNFSINSVPASPAATLQP